jgi:hypothetical protein
VLGREEHAGDERYMHRTTASTSAAASTQSLGCGSNRQVIMLRSEGLGVPLGGSKGLGSASVGLLRAWECFWGLVAAKFVKCPKSYYREQFEKYGYIRDKYDFDV